MAGDFDDLVEHLLYKIALSGSQGFDFAQLRQIVNDFYASRKCPSEPGSGPEPTELDILFSNAPPKEGATVVDDALLNKVWNWLVAHQNVRLFDTTDNDKSELASGSAATRQRLTTSKNSMWNAITGHGVDHQRVPPLEFECLSVIAGGGAKGVTQPDLVRLTGQDKRSVPKRTDNLVEKGYIKKEAVISHSAKTSLLTLKRFAQDRANDTGQAGASDTTASIRLVRYDTWYDKTISLLKDNGNVMMMSDLRAGLGLKPRTQDRRSWMACVRRLARIGCIKRVMAHLENAVKQNGDKKYERCLLLLREPTESDRRAFKAVWRGSAAQSWEKEGEDGQALASSDEDNDNGMESDNTSGAEDEVLDSVDLHKSASTADNSAQLSDPRSYMVPLWTPERPYGNLIFDLVEKAGSQGLSSTEVSAQSLGSLFRRPLDELMLRLTDFGESSQPPHLRHLTIVRDTISTGKHTMYHYRTLENFEKAVETGLTSKDATQQSTKKGKNKAHAAAQPDLDSWGFPKINQKLFASPDGCSSLGDIINLADAVDKSSGAARHTRFTEMKTLYAKQARMQAKAEATSGRSEAVDLAGKPKASAYDDSEHFKSFAKTLAKRLARNEFGRSSDQYNPSAGDPKPPPHKSRRSLRTSTKVVNDDDGHAAQPESITRQSRPSISVTIPKQDGKKPAATSAAATLNSFSESDDRAAEIEAELLARTRPGVYINPPGARALKAHLQYAPGSGRRKAMKIAVLKSNLLKTLSWFVQEGRSLASSFRTPLTAGDPNVAAATANSWTRSRKRTRAEYQVDLEEGTGEGTKERTASVVQVEDQSRSGEYALSDGRGRSRPLEPARKRLKKTNASLKEPEAKQPNESTELQQVSQDGNTAGRSQRTSNSARDASDHAGDFAAPQTCQISTTELERRQPQPPEQTGNSDLAYEPMLGVSMPQKSNPLPSNSPEATKLGGSAVELEDGADGIIRNSAEADHHALRHDQVHAVLSPEPEQQSPKAESSRKKMYSAAPHGRSKVVMSIIESYGGAFPGNGEIRFPFAWEWQKTHVNCPDRKTILKTVKNLVDSARLQKFAFTFQTSKGQTATVEVLALPTLGPESEQVQEMKRSMQSAWPQRFIPNEVKVDDTSMVQTGPEEASTAPETPTLLAAPEGGDVDSGQVKPPRFYPHPNKNFFIEPGLVVKRAGFVKVPDNPTRKSRLAKGGKVRSARKQNPGQATRATDQVDADDASDEEDLDFQFIMEHEFGTNLTHNHLSFPFSITETDFLQSHFNGHTFTWTQFGRTPQKKQDSQIDVLQDAAQQEEPNDDSEAPSPKNGAIRAKGPHHGNLDIMLMDPSQHLYEISGTIGTQSIVDGFRAVPPPAVPVTERKLARARNKSLPLSLEDILSRDPIHRRPLKRSRVGDYARFCAEVDSVVSWEVFVLVKKVELMPAAELRFINHTTEEHKSARPAFADLRFQRPIDRDPSSLPRTRRDPKQRLDRLFPKARLVRQRISYDEPTFLDPRDFELLLTNVDDQMEDADDTNASPGLLGQKRKSHVAFEQDEDDDNEENENEEGAISPTKGPPPVRSSARPSRKRAYTKRTPRVRYGDDNRLVAAMALARVLCGGFRKHISWGILDQLFDFKYGIDVLKDRWSRLRHTRTRYTRRLEDHLSDKFLDAYARGEIPRVNFDKVEQVDWATLLKWTESKVVPTLPGIAIAREPTPEDDDVLELPPERGMIAEEVDISLPTSTNESMLNKFFVEESYQVRERLANGFLPGLIMDGNVGNDDVMLAMSWVRASAATKGQMFNKSDAVQKLSLLDKNVLAHALALLECDQVLQRVYKNRRLPGRNFVLHGTFLAQFERWPRRDFLEDVARGRAEILAHLRDNDDFEMGKTEDDMFTVALTNMMNQGLLRLDVDLSSRNEEWDGEFPKLSAMNQVLDGGYQAKYLEMERLYFPVTYRKTEKFTDSHGLKTGIPVPMQPSQVRGEPYLRIPCWTDLHGNLMPEMWELVLKSTLHLVVYRPGITAEGIMNAHNGKIWEWEIDMVTKWLEDAGIAQRWAAGHERDGIWKGGWRATEWWYCAFVPEMKVWTLPTNN